MESENRKSLSENVFEEGRNIYGSGENEIRFIVHEEEFKYRISNPKRNLETSQIQNIDSTSEIIDLSRFNYFSYDKPIDNYIFNEFQKDNILKDLENCFEMQVLVITIMLNESVFLGKFRLFKLTMFCLQSRSKYNSNLDDEIRCNDSINNIEVNDFIRYKKTKPLKKPRKRLDYNDEVDPQLKITYKPYELAKININIKSHKSEKSIISPFRTIKKRVHQAAYNYFSIIRSKCYNIWKIFIKFSFLRNLYTLKQSLLSIMMYGNIQKKILEFWL